MSSAKLKHPMLIGFFGVAIIIYGILASSFSYIGCSGENYNFLNHFISELGQYKCSEKASIFNFCLILGTPFLIFYYLQIIPDSSKIVKVFFRWMISIIGFSAMSIGVFSMDNIFIHIVSALVFFYLCFFASLLFVIYFCFIKEEQIPIYFIISAILILLTTLLNIIQFHQLDSNMLIILNNRPRILLICIVEWSSLLAMFLFFLSSIIFFKQRTSSIDN